MNLFMCSFLREVTQVQNSQSLFATSFDVFDLDLVVLNPKSSSSRGVWNDQSKWSPRRCWIALASVTHDVFFCRLGSCPQALWICEKDVIF